LTYSNIERERAIAWKRATGALPPGAKIAAGYSRHPDARSHDFCVPTEYASASLLPEVRATTLRLFAELGIPWHDGVGSGPSNHLLSSQVQCANALGQMVADPERIIRAFGPLLGTAEVLHIEPGRHLTFEYIGDTDYFGEAPGSRRVRGARCTSVDAAFLHRTVEGLVELILVEWKYTESYRPREVDEAKDTVRWKRYGAALTAPDCPVRTDLLDFEDLLDEPLYQLVRQQLLAHELEKAGAHGASRVRVVHVRPERNVAYQQSLHRASQRALGGTVDEVWHALLRQRDRFVSMDSSVFLNSAITSSEYVRRYGDTVPPKGLARPSEPAKT
jgi:hypothetical protein